MDRVNRFSSKQVDKRTKHPSPNASKKIKPDVMKAKLHKNNLKIRMNEFRRYKLNG